MRTKNSDNGASVRERKAAALDTLVKTELTKKRTAEATKMSNLRALRLARDAELSAPATLEIDAVKKTASRRAARTRSS
jgi:hypothetical protein